MGSSLKSFLMALYWPHVEAGMHESHQDWGCLLLIFNFTALFQSENSHDREAPLFLVWNANPWCKKILTSSPLNPWQNKEFLWAYQIPSSWEGLKPQRGFYKCDLPNTLHLPSWDFCYATIFLQKTICYPRTHLRLWKGSGVFKAGTAGVKQWQLMTYAEICWQC